MRISSSLSTCRTWLASCSIALVLAACGSGDGSVSINVNADVPPGGLSQSAALAQFDVLWTAFDQNYSYFDHKSIDWEALRTEYRPKAALVRTQDALNAVLVEMLGKLHDGHVHLDSTDGKQIATYQSHAFVNWDATVAQQYAARLNITQIKPGFGYASLDGGAYIGIASWRTGQFDAADVDALLEAVKDSPALIIDVRMNPGGDDTLAGALAGRLTSVPRVGDYVRTRNGPRHDDFTAVQARIAEPRGAWQYTKPILLLVGRRSASTTESFISFMRTLPNVTIVGDTTAGSSGNPASFKLTDTWSFTVSRWINYTADMQVIEDKGIAPAIAVPVAAEDFLAGRDPVLDYALVKLPTLK